MHPSSVETHSDRLICAKLMFEIVAHDFVDLTIVSIVEPSIMESHG